MRELAEQRYEGILAELESERESRLAAEQPLCHQHQGQQAAAPVDALTEQGATSQMVPISLKIEVVAAAKPLLTQNQNSVQDIPAEDASKPKLMLTQVHGACHHLACDDVVEVASVQDEVSPRTPHAISTFIESSSVISGDSLNHQSSDSARSSTLQDSSKLCHEDLRTTSARVLQTEIPLAGERPSSQASAVAAQTQDREVATLSSPVVDAVASLAQVQFDSVEQSLPIPTFHSVAGLSVIALLERERSLQMDLQTKLMEKLTKSMSARSCGAQMLSLIHI